MIAHHNMCARLIGYEPAHIYGRQESSTKHRRQCREMSLEMSLDINVSIECSTMLTLARASISASIRRHFVIIS